MPNPPKFIAIVAMAANRTIGRDGELPWRLPEDIKFFRRTTTGHAILMGRKTWESIRKPLPERRNIVLSRSLKSAPEGVELIRHPDELAGLNLETDVYVIGGAVVYACLLPRCEEVLQTYVFAEYEGDTFLPPFEDDFQLAEILEKHPQFEIRRYVR